jgi:hypothetical protein
MKVAVKGTPPDDWPLPDGVVSATVCGTSGLLATSTCPNPISEVFIRGTEPTEFDLSSAPAPTPSAGPAPVVASVPLRVTAPSQGQAVTAPFSVEGATDPSAVVNLSVVAAGSFVKINVAETRVPVTPDGQFSYVVQPTLHTSGTQYVITVTATTTNGGRSTQTLIVNER